MRVCVSEGPGIGSHGGSQQGQVAGEKSPCFTGTELLRVLATLCRRREPMSPRRHARM